MKELSVQHKIFFDLLVYFSFFFEFFVLMYKVELLRKFHLTLIDQIVAERLIMPLMICSFGSFALTDIITLVLFLLIMLFRTIETRC